MSFHSRRPITGYTILTGDPLYSTATKVLKALESGWELYGDPFVLGESICQAVIQYDPPKEEPEEEEAEEETKMHLCGEAGGKPGSKKCTYSYGHLGLCSWEMDEL